MRKVEACLHGAGRVTTKCPNDTKEGIRVKGPKDVVKKSCFAAEPFMFEVVLLGKMKI